MSVNFFLVQGRFWVRAIRIDVDVTGQQVNVDVKSVYLTVFRSEDGWEVKHSFPGYKWRSWYQFSPTTTDFWGDPINRDIYYLVYQDPEAPSRRSWVQGLGETTFDWIKKTTESWFSNYETVEDQYIHMRHFKMFHLPAFVRSLRTPKDGFGVSGAPVTWSEANYDMVLASVTFENNFHVNSSRLYISYKTENKPMDEEEVDDNVVTFHLKDKKGKGKNKVRKKIK